jgi:hypothetical protein
MYGQRWHADGPQGRSPQHDRLVGAPAGLPVGHGDADRFAGVGISGAAHHGAVQHGGDPENVDGAVCLDGGAAGQPDFVARAGWG